jgi:ribosomal protein S18 acetylase RimI-like enzyme
LKNLLLGGFNRRDIFDAYPAHLRINLKEDFRHQGLGSALVERFFAQARQANLAGVQASVCQDNRPACGFFERLGFSVLGTYPMARFHKTDGFKTSRTVIYGRRI